MLKLIRKANNGATPGTSGWCAHHVLVLWKGSEFCKEQFKRLFITLLNGCFDYPGENDHALRNLFLQTDQTLISREGVDPRPISMPELFYKLACAYALQLLPPGEVLFPNGIQKIIKIKGAGQAHIHGAQNALEKGAHLRCLVISRKIILIKTVQRVQLKCLPINI
jgi:hypothetical protein